MGVSVKYVVGLLTVWFIVRLQPVMSLAMVISIRYVVRLPTISKVCCYGDVSKVCCQAAVGMAWCQAAISSEAGIANEDVHAALFEKLE